MNKNWTAILIELKKLCEKQKELSVAFNNFFSVVSGEDSNFVTYMSQVDGYLNALSFFVSREAFDMLEYFAYEAPSLDRTARVIDLDKKEYDFKKLEEAVKYFEKWHPL